MTAVLCAEYDVEVIFKSDCPMAYTSPLQGFGLISLFFRWTTSIVDVFRPSIGRLQHFRKNLTKKMTGKATLQKIILILYTSKYN